MKIGALCLSVAEIAHPHSEAYTPALRGEFFGVLGFPDRYSFDAGEEGCRTSPSNFVFQLEIRKKMYSSC
jgi:hypothetical protein